MCVCVCVCVGGGGSHFGSSAAADSSFVTPFGGGFESRLLLCPGRWLQRILSLCACRDSTMSTRCSRFASSRGAEYLTAVAANERRVCLRKHVQEAAVAAPPLPLPSPGLPLPRAAGGPLERFGVSRAMLTPPVTPPLLELDGFTFSSQEGPGRGKVRSQKPLFYVNKIDVFKVSGSKKIEK